MTRDIRATRDAFHLTTAGLARLVGVTDRTAYRWMAGTLSVPEPVWRLLELVEWAADGDESGQPFYECVRDVACRVFS